MRPGIRNWPILLRQSLDTDAVTLDLDPTANNLNIYLQVAFDTGNCKAFATIAGHLQKAAGVRLPTSSKLAGPS